MFERRWLLQMDGYGAIELAMCVFAICIQYETEQSSVYSVTQHAQNMYVVPEHYLKDFNLKKRLKIKNWVDFKRNMNISKTIFN